MRARNLISASAQGTLGWVAGCAWTDVAVDVFPTMSMEPGALVLLANSGVAIVLSLLSVAFLVGSGASSTITEEGLTKREEVAATSGPSHPGPCCELNQILWRMRGSARCAQSP